MVNAALSLEDDLEVGANAVGDAMTAAAKGISTGLGAVGTGVAAAGQDMGLSKDVAQGLGDGAVSAIKVGALVAATPAGLTLIAADASTSSDTADSEQSKSSSNGSGVDASAAVTQVFGLVSMGFAAADIKNVLTGKDSATQKAGEFGAGLVVLGDGDNQLSMWGDANAAILGSGDNKVIVNGTGTLVMAGGGDNRFEMNTAASLVIAKGGDDYLKEVGAFNQAYLGDGNNHAELVGMANLVDTGAGTDVVNLYGIANMATAGKCLRCSQCGGHRHWQ
jgi:hypothetical protein